MGREERLNNGARSVELVLSDGALVTLEATHGGVMESGAIAFDCPDGSAHFFSASAWRTAHMGPIVTPKIEIVTALVKP